jgi:hypothetical protein
MIEWIILGALTANAAATVGLLILSWKNSAKIEVVHLATNSMREQLVSVTASDSFQKGEAQERSRTHSQT